VDGTYLLDAEHSAAGRVTRRYQLSIHIPLSFPQQPPVVLEVGGVIPNDSDFHVNGHNGSLCLGSPLALKRLLRSHPDLQVFMARTLRPYLYAVSVKLDRGGPFVFGELRHGAAGKLQDLADDLRIAESSVDAALDLALMASIDANRMPCPCGCARSLGECSLRDRIDDLRALAGEDELHALRDEIARIDLIAILESTTKQIVDAAAQLSSINETGSSK